MKPSLLILTYALCLFLIGCTSTSLHQPQKSAQHPPKIALVLGGGGAKGLAHIGVIKALTEHGIKPDLVVGTSAGAIVGALYASGKNANTLEHIALDTNYQELLDFRPSKQGLIEGKKLRDFINQHTQSKPIQKLPIRFVAVATHKNTGQMSIFDTGETGLAVQASASVPRLFIAPRIPENGGQKYIDGGQATLVPARVAKNLGTKIIIAVDVLGRQPPRTLDPSFDTHHPSKNIGFWQLFEQFTPNTQISPQDINASDIIIRPHLPYSVFDTSERLAMIQAGYAATLPHISQIHTLIKQHNQAQ